MRIRMVHWLFFIILIMSSIDTQSYWCASWEEEDSCARKEALALEEKLKEELKEMEDVVRQLVVVINGQFDGEVTMGAGFVFRRERERVYIATANHVVRRAHSAKRLEVKFSMLPDTSLSARLMPQFSKEPDLAMLVVDDLDKHGINPCEWYVGLLHKPDSLRRGDNIFHIGHPHGIKWLFSVSPDKVMRVINGDIVFQTSAISVGHSGGILLDEDRMITGMITSDTKSYGRAITIEKVSNTLEQWGYGVQLYTGTDLPPLYKAIMEGNLNTVGSLTDETCTDINEESTSYGMRITPLKKAIADDHKDIVALLLKKGADPNLNNPLATAVYRANIEIVALLIEHGADPNPGLSYAAWNDESEILELLLSAGGTVDYRSSEASSTPLLTAVERNSLQSIDVLLAYGADVNAVKSNGKGSLHIATHFRYLEVIQKLIKKNPNLNQKDDDGKTPLYVAIQRRWGVIDEHLASNRDAIINLFLESGANVNIVDNSGNTVLHVVIDRSYLNLIGRLLVAGANVNIANNSGETVLHRLMYNDSLYPEERGNTIFNTLLAYGANPNVINKDRETPLYLAVRMEKMNFIRRLIKAGARTDILDKDSKTLLDIARNNSDHRTIEILTKAMHNDSEDSLGHPTLSDENY